MGHVLDAADVMGKQRAHESYVEHATVEGPSDRSFGLTIGAILVAFAVFRWTVRDAPPGQVALIAGPGIVLLVLALVAPGALAHPNRLWTKLGELLARIFNPVVMMLMFAFIFVPVALVMRAMGRDQLRLRTDAGAESYWVMRVPPGPAPESITQQF